MMPFQLTAIVALIASLVSGAGVWWVKDRQLGETVANYEASILKQQVEAGARWRTETEIVLRKQQDNAAKAATLEVKSRENESNANKLVADNRTVTQQLRDLSKKYRRDSNRAVPEASTGPIEGQDKPATDSGLLLIRVDEIEALDTFAQRCEGDNLNYIDAYEYIEGIGRD